MLPVVIGKFVTKEIVTTVAFQRLKKTLQNVVFVKDVRNKYLFICTKRLTSILSNLTESLDNCNDIILYPQLAGNRYPDVEVKKVH